MGDSLLEGRYGGRNQVQWFWTIVRKRWFPAPYRKVWWCSLSGGKRRAHAATMH